MPRSSKHTRKNKENKGRKRKHNESAKASSSSSSSSSSASSDEEYYVLDDDPRFSAGLILNPGMGESHYIKNHSRKSRKHHSKTREEDMSYL